jgi:hypothetical protein
MKSNVTSERPAEAPREARCFGMPRGLRSSLGRSLRALVATLIVLFSAAVTSACVCYDIGKPSFGVQVVAQDGTNLLPVAVVLVTSEGHGSLDRIPPAGEIGGRLVYGATGKLRVRVEAEGYFPHELTINVRTDRCGQPCEFKRLKVILDPLVPAFAYRRAPEVITPCLEVDPPATYDPLGSLGFRGGSYGQAGVRRLARSNG